MQFQTNCDNNRFRYSRAWPRASGPPALTSALPVADRPAIDVDEIRPRIIADAAAAQARCRPPHLRQAAAFAAQIDRHALDVITVAGDPAAVSVHPRVGGR